MFDPRKIKPGRDSCGACGWGGLSTQEVGTMKFTCRESWHTYGYCRRCGWNYREETSDGRVQGG